MNSRYRSFSLLLFVCWIALNNFSATLSAQEGRYELGRRLKRFEQGWQSANDTQRASSVPAMERAVSSFFSLRWLDAASQLDNASRVFAGQLADDANYRWAMAQRIAISPTFTDVESTRLSIELSPFYTGESLPSEGIQLEFVLRPLSSTDELFAWNSNHSDTDAIIRWKEIVNVESDSGNWNFELPSLDEGDYWLVTNAIWGMNRVEVARCITSRTRNLTARIERLESAIDEGKGSGTASGRATLRNCMSILEYVREGSVQEIDYPAHQILRDCEKLVELGLDSRPFFKQTLEGNAWFAFGQDKRTAICRVYVPKAMNDNPRPVLFLFHGAGGSENMFFETYGAGRAVALARERGWIVVAPRQALLGGLGMSAEQIVQVLEEHLPVDREQVYFLGHSMGASQAVSQATLAPKLPNAVVALGGGGRIGKVTGSTTRWFVGAGDRDFGLRGAQTLGSTLKASGREVELKVYPNVEHMVIVQAALDDVFEFLDKPTN